MANLGQLLEAARPWISTIANVGLLGFVAQLWLSNRKLRIVESKADREGYGMLIKALQEDIALVRIEHRRCEDRLSKIEGELMGFHRQAILQSQQNAASLPASQMVKDAGDRAAAASLKASTTP